MRILLIKPPWFVRGGVYRYLEKVKFTPLHLGILAALSDSHEVICADGDWDEIPYEMDVDLVGITATTFTSQRAYAIARRFRQRGVPVVLGGVHPSILPEECLQHADAVVVGEAEYVWRDVLHDAEKRQLKRVYRAERVTDMNDVPFPRRDLLNEQSWFASLQATRGCPHVCKYCYLPSVPWHVYRKRDPDVVQEELRRMRQPLVYFIDDNFFADPAYARAIADRIAPLRKKWSVQAPTTIVNHEDLVARCAASGLFNVQIGFQTVNPASLDWAAVRQNRVGTYRRLVAMLHRYGILVTGFFIFGFDTDDQRIFAETVRTIKELDLDEAHLYILTPYPGTALYEEFRRAGRLDESRDRSHYGWANAVFTPKLMTARELEEGVQWMYQELYPFFRRKFAGIVFKRLPWLLRNPVLLGVLWSGNRRHVAVGEHAG